MDHSGITFTNVVAFSPIRNKRFWLCHVKNYT
jgi:hypothetical protein